ncbi:alpha/beta hydrolase family protein [Pseudomonas sp. SDO528_S397]
MKGLSAALLLIGLTGTALANDPPIGFQTMTLQDSAHERPLEMVVWYPTPSTAQPQLIADNPAFVGVNAVTNAPPAGGEHPLVVISHGYLGNWSSQAWLATALAHKGYVVAAVNHPGSTTHDRSPAAAAQLWQRPGDVRRAIDAVLAEPSRFGAVAPRNIAVVGHSLGGWTALEIGGARFDAERFDADCKVHVKLAPCQVYTRMNPERAPLAGDLSDKRVSAIVSLDLGLSRGFTDASLAAFKVPTLIIAAGVPSEDLPAQVESADLARRLPTASTRYVEISDASHFSFLPLCKPGAVSLLEEDVPGDGIICQDGPGEGARTRPVIQQQVTALIDAFLQHPAH